MPAKFAQYCTYVNVCVSSIVKDKDVTTVLINPPNPEFQVKTWTNGESDLYNLLRSGEKELIKHYKERESTLAKVLGNKVTGDTVRIRSITLPCTSEGRKYEVVESDIFWGKARTEKIKDICSEKKHVILKGTYKICHKKLNHSDDPLERGKWGFCKRDKTEARMNDLTSKLMCDDKEKCETYLRLADGDNSVDNRAHTALYKHPLKSMRENNIFGKMGKGNPISFRSLLEEHKAVDLKRNLLEELVKEIRKNRCASDLFYGEETKSEEKVRVENLPIMRIVDEKMTHPRHIALGEPLEGRKDLILALVLYTSRNSKCGAHLYKTQQSGDYAKWQVFDKCLDLAIQLLSERETFSSRLYMGLKGVEFEEGDEKEPPVFLTYVSASKRKDVALRFRGEIENPGTLVVFDECNQLGVEMMEDTLEKLGNPGVCADVSWISDFPDEMEVLFRRGKTPGWRVTVSKTQKDGMVAKIGYFGLCFKRVFLCAMCRLLFGYENSYLRNDQLVTILNRRFELDERENKLSSESGFMELMTGSLEGCAREWETDFGLSLKEIQKALKARLAISKARVRIEKDCLDLLEYKVYYFHKKRWKRVSSESHKVTLSALGKWESKADISKRIEGAGDILVQSRKDDDY